MKNETKVVVTGLGAVSPFGIGVDALWHGLCRGQVATRSLSRFDTWRCRSDQGGEVDCELLRQYGDRDVALSTAFALSAAEEAVGDARLALNPGLPSALYLGTVFGTRPDLENQTRAGATIRPLDEIASAVARDVGVTEVAAQLSMACASGNGAISAGAQAIRRGRVDAAVVGGVEQLSETMLMMFSAMRALSPDVVRPFDRNREGLILSEGAAVVVLESAHRAEERGAEIYCELAAEATVCEAFDIVAPEPSGEGARRAMTTALRRSGEEPSSVDYVSAHGTGTPANDTAEALAIEAAFNHSPKVTALKSMVGHMQGAAGAVGVIAGALSIRDGVVPPTPTLRELEPGRALDVPTVAESRPVRTVLNNAFGFGGNVSSLLLRAWP